MVKPLITLAVQCHNFQRRLCWMLSSLAAQTVASSIVVDVAFMSNNGRPTTESVCDRFDGMNGLSIRRSQWDDVERFAKRGLIRNRQLQECQTEWLMFGDCDMVYHPDYFEKLGWELTNHPQATYMLSSGRTSNPKDKTNKLVDTFVGGTPVMVQQAFAMVNALPKVPMRNVGAGFCQLINVKHAPHGGYYVAEKENRDWHMMQRGSNPKSDMHFRRRISHAGGPRRALPQWFSENAIHLNHNRDPEAGCHLQEQR